MVRLRPLIAVVDDEDAVRLALGRLLKSAGLDVEAFASGEEFLASMYTHEPDCLVLDLHMMPPDGFEVQSRLRQRGASVPTVVITGRDLPQIRQRVLDAGASAYLHKPFDDKELLDAIYSAMDQRPR